ncbi:hypothetical protein FRC08_015159, partial [Ceratobasidium sp. 394]
SPQAPSGSRFADNRGPDNDNMSIDTHSMHSASRQTSPVPCEVTPTLSISSDHQQNETAVENPTFSPASPVTPHTPIDLGIKYGDDEDEAMYFARYEATDDPAYIRLAYLNALVSSVVFHDSTEGVNMSLCGTFDCLRLASALPDDLKPLMTLEAVRSRLGLETNAYMT